MWGDQVAGAQNHSIRTGRGWSGLVRIGSNWFGWDQAGSNRFEPVQVGSSRSGPVRVGSGRFGLVRTGSSPSELDRLLRYRFEPVRTFRIRVEPVRTSSRAADQQHQWWCCLPPPAVQQQQQHQQQSIRAAAPDQFGPVRIRSPRIVPLQDSRAQYRASTNCAQHKLTSTICGNTISWRHKFQDPQTVPPHIVELTSSRSTVYASRNQARIRLTVQDRGDQDSWKHKAQEHNSWKHEFVEARGSRSTDCASRPRASLSSQFQDSGRSRFRTQAQDTRYRGDSGLRLQVSCLQVQQRFRPGSGSEARIVAPSGSAQAQAQPRIVEAQDSGSTDRASRFHARLRLQFQDSRSQVSCCFRIRIPGFKAQAQVQESCQVQAQAPGLRPLRISQDRCRLRIQVPGFRPPGFVEAQAQVQVLCCSRLQVPGFRPLQAQVQAGSGFRGTVCGFTGFKLHGLCLSRSATFQASIRLRSTRPCLHKLWKHRFQVPQIVDQRLRISQTLMRQMTGQDSCCVRHPSP